ncbi:MAG: LytTR family DNA-binding domain-containing protein [Bacteroidota bacterium]|nr:LytTR family DNA-binding domain-containing protein [Bacteroidota bacterium]MDP4245247.1 LytTR family DNA-binding domain-containing protein [Bacteroidota bacterium]MDP4255849.1 LytTR family DNA-binding domain-containing protein [Bacteroidota bacterium]MDP4260297.1 LytTR family DNA-binding domain-containing protein [Bacteroidota bacterium]
MINAIIIDDEQHCIDHLARSLDAQCRSSIHLAGSFHTTEEGRRAILDLKPDLVFLDIQIGEETGFDLLGRLPSIHFDIIFVTAYEKYAIQAFKFSAIDYLLKPIDPDDLQQAVIRLQQKRSKEELAQKFDTLFHNLKNVPGLSKRITVPTVKGLVFLPVSDIVRCESHINYTTLFLKDGRRLTVAKTLKEFEELLTEYDFYRVHNSHLINLACIKSYNKGKGGSVCMTDNSEIEVSTRRKEDLLKRLAGL